MEPPDPQGVTVLRGELASVFVAGYARSLARVGRPGLLAHLDSVAAMAVPVSSLEFPNDSMLPEDYPASEIRFPNTNVDVAGLQVTVVGSMKVLGDYGLQTISPQMLLDEDGISALVSNIPPVQDFKRGPGRISSWDMSTVLNFDAPREYGLRVEASTAHESWWGVTPVPSLPLSMMPEWMRIGRATAASAGVGNQPACGGGAGSGGGGSGGDGRLMGHYVCYSRDWYDGDGNYLFTVFGGCYLQYTYWLAE